MDESEITQMRLDVCLEYRGIIKDNEKGTCPLSDSSLKLVKSQLEEIQKEMLSIKRACTHNKPSCPYHACMNNGCQIEIVISQGLNFGQPFCNLKL